MGEGRDDNPRRAGQSVSERAYRYSPPPKEQRAGTALCLSGGGYRAVLFHLGGLRRLNELGILGKIEVISSVSGGSIVAGALARHVSPWPGAGKRIDDFDAVVARPLRAFTSRNIRTLRIVSRLLSWNWAKRDGAVQSLAKTYERRLIGISLTELPERPKFVFCATDMAFGVNWVFDSGSFHEGRRRVGDYLGGYLKEFPDWPVAQAVAASSCFPPVFNPMRLQLKAENFARGEYSKDDWGELIEHIGLSDGGVYDNMGLEPVWKRARTVLVSDGGAVFKVERDTGLVRRINRYTAVAGRQGGAVRKRWLISNFLSGVMDGTYWGLGSVAGHYPETATPFYAEGLVDEVISDVRTDLDAFSEAEQAVLENHGYLLADAAARSHLAGVIEPGSPEPKVPYEEWLDEAKVRRALADSHKRKALGRW